jgi:hypothetical protein
MDSGPSPIREAAELTSIHRQARAVHFKSLLTAAVLTLVLLSI